jgi:hypothetical protein
MNWDMDKVDCPIVSIMEHIHACFSVCAEITGIDNLSCTDFIDVTDPVALDEAIYWGAHSNSSCGLGRNPGVVLGELVRMSAASSRAQSWHGGETLWAGGSSTGENGIHEVNKKCFR